MTASLILFVFFIIIYTILSDIITIFFRLTGMTEETARFQVISLLTNSGFTTRESEAVVASRARRRLAKATMLFGYIFTVTIMSTIVNFFMTVGKTELEQVAILIPSLFILLVVFQLIRKSPVFKNWFDTNIEKLGNRLMFGSNKNPIVLLDDYGNMVVAHIYLQNVPELLQGKTLAESGLMQKYNLMVMMVKTHNGDATQATAHTILQNEDIIMVLGNQKKIREVFL